MTTLMPLFDQATALGARARTAQPEDEAFGAMKFVEGYELLAESPGGVDALRQLVIDLAVRGSLVNQRADEGTGGELIEAIRR